MPTQTAAMPSTRATRSPVGSRGTLVLALVLLAAGLVWVVHLARQQCEGTLAYALDDAYIHLAIAKNVALHGTWGVSANRFSTASSSLAWPAAASALFCVIGVREWVLLALNVAFACLAVIIPWSIFSARRAPAWLVLVMLAILTLATPLIPLVLSGMEHVAQAVVSLLFLYSACQGLVEPEKKSCGLRPATAALLLAPTVTAVRYEGMFLIAAVAALYCLSENRLGEGDSPILLGGLRKIGTVPGGSWIGSSLLRRRWRWAIAIAAAGMLPVVLAGIWFKSQGWFFLPASVVLKGSMPDLHSAGGLWAFASGAAVRMWFSPHMPALMVVVAISTFGLGRRVWHETAGLMGVAFLAVAVMHLFFARLGWFYRYEAYLVYLGLTVLMLQWLDCYRDRPARVALPQYRWVLPALFIVLVWPIGDRSVRAHYDTPGACTNIYQQQMQSALLLREYYPGATVAADDVGAISFFADIDCVDLMGLADLDVAQAVLAGKYDVREMNRVARSRGATIAIVYKKWFGSTGAPHTWIEAASLEMQNNLVCGDATVTLYAIDADAIDLLRAHLRQFQPRLPAGVRMSFAPL